jgi:chromosome segregation ATPase
MEDKKSFLQMLATQLQEWDTELDELKVKVHLAKADAKDELLKQIDELRAKKETAQSTLKQLQEAGDEAWDDIKGGLERSWTELTGAFRSAMAKFKDEKK